MKQLININHWNRKEHFLFFKEMDEPFFGITTNIDCTFAYANAKKLNIPFFNYYLHKTLVAINAFENFKYRIINDQVYLFDQIDASATIMREDKTFGFSFIEFNENINIFNENTSQEIIRVKNTTGLFTRDFPLINLIHFSTIPWINFSSLLHARSYKMPDSCPKITFGQLTHVNNIKSMPVSIHVHHGLVDGYHVGEFVNLLQELLNS